MTRTGASVLAWLAVAAAGPVGATPPKLLPQPELVVERPGRFRLDSGTRISVPAGDAGARRAAEGFADLMARSRGLRLRVVEGGGGTIRFVRTTGATEAYSLNVTPNRIVIGAGHDAGLFYGGVTLWQLATQGEERSVSVPAVSVRDGPRFGWRGLMLDSARHYQSPEFVRSLIDWMAAHKLNRLHWHLVDDQGWRLQILKYPRLTEVSAWRTPASAPGAPTLPRVGGFYTQAEVRAIVAYAAARQVMIVPEIEMPGHALSAIRAYPALGTGVVPPAGIESDWGVFPYLYNVDDSTFGFLQDVLTEVMDLFPSPYIHVGGDEAVKDQWKASPAVQARMRALGIHDENALQGWFMARIGAFLKTKGRRLIGWDEILEGGVPADATVMSWRGIDGAIEAASAGHDTVLAPSPALYLNHVQGTGQDEPPGRGGAETLAAVYAFDPVPPALPIDRRHHVLGLQGNLWTEHARTEARAAWMMFPRASAIAEIGWSAAVARDYRSFLSRLMPQLDRLTPFGLRAATSAFTPAVAAEPADGTRATVTLSNQSALPMRYTLDGRAPGAGAPVYTGPVTVTLPARLRVASILDGRVLPGAIDRRLDTASVRRRDNRQLDLCGSGGGLSLEDDAPAAGPRAVFTVDIVKPCWIWRGAPLDGVTGIAVDVGQVPFNFQIGDDRKAIRFNPPATAEGEIEVRVDGCDGRRIAVLPLAPAVSNPAITTLRAGMPPIAGRHDLCLTYTARGPDPLWVVNAVQLSVAP